MTCYTVSRVPVSEQGAWDKASAGGAIGRAHFFTNPQYSMVLTQPKTKIHIQLEAPREVRGDKIWYVPTWKL